MLAAALLLTGCSAAWEGSRGGAEPAAGGVTDVFLQPLSATGPDPFTASTVRNAVRPPTPERDSEDTAQQAHEVTGSTPGLYGGTRSVGSCDVPRQSALLTADQDKKRAFAEASGIPESNVEGWLRGLTPVVLRADVRVTSHGYRETRPRPFQSVLQAGTAVLVDPYGAPRVRCAGGNPLRTPAADPSGIHRGDPWDGFDPDRVIVVRPTTSVVTSLVIVNATDRSWIERRTGSDGADDRAPDVPPTCDPDACTLTGEGTPDRTAPGTGTPDRTAPGTPDTAPPGRPTGPDADPPVRPVPPPPVPSEPVSPPIGPDPSGSGGTGTEPAPAHPEPYPFPDPEQHPEEHPDTPPEHPADPYGDPFPDPYGDPFPDPYAEPPTAPDGELPPDQVFPAAPVPDRHETFQG
ncbi:DUF6777 domain-containing protein [Streptomyces sp. NPDC093249]|uniref:DUF6777 domain-containing protein n=1 Tax=unclassified Streptomyces TaxID=2593676 RepID=UPI00344C824E